jgi:hypothetical protein
VVCGAPLATFLSSYSTIQCASEAHFFYFRLVTGENGLTTQLTPRLKSINLYIKELNNEKLVVGCGDAGSFDYLVNGLRKGYENYQVVRSK